MKPSATAAGPTRQGKVRDLYDWGDALLLVATDRISAFDWVLSTPIPDKGRVLTQISKFWFERLGQAHHMLSADLESPEFAGRPLEGVTLPPGESANWLSGRAMLVKKCSPAPVECVVRGYLAGSGWKEYQQTGAVCGVKLPAGLSLCAELPEPIFTPATKAETGHDENISFATMVEMMGRPAAEELRQRSLETYLAGARIARERGVIIADTKFEWGLCDGRWLLIDEALTPDSSRFWPADHYAAGRDQPSFDKQFVRAWLEQTDWDKNSPPPALPPDVVAKTREKYVEAYERLTGETFAWK
jgi:phosphoribosylaminoimidazole-succinocarboxamide synthase